MRNLFFYGTLLDTALLRVVLGRDLREGEVRPARLRGYEVCAVAGMDFPFARASEGGVAEGIVVSDLSETDVERLNFYEGAYLYSLVPIEVEVENGVLAAEFFLGNPGDWEARGSWSIEAWQAADGGVAAEAATEVMAHFGQRPAEDVLKHYNVMRAQAQSRLTARKSTKPGRLRRGFGQADVKTEEIRRPYLDFFSVIERRLRFRKFNGDWSDPVERTVFVAVDAVSVLPYDPVNDLVLLIEQFRAAPLARGDAYPWCVEAIAGRQDVGESPEETAMREAREEAGLELQALEKIAQYYPSPAGLSEYLVSFVGIAGLTQAQERVHGVESEHEDIRAFTITFEELIVALENGEIENAPLVLSAQWLQLNRERLRAAYGAA